MKFHTTTDYQKHRAKRMRGGQRQRMFERWYTSLTQPSNYEAPRIDELLMYNDRIREAVERRKTSCLDMFSSPGHGEILVDLHYGQAEINLYLMRSENVITGLHKYE